MKAVLEPFAAAAAAGAETQSLSSPVKALRGEEGKGREGSLEPVGLLVLLPLPQACAVLDGLHLWP